MAQTHAPSVPSLPARAAPVRARLVLAGSLVLGVVLALVTIPEFSPWMHAHFGHHHWEAAVHA